MSIPRWRLEPPSPLDQPTGQAGVSRVPLQSLRAANPLVLASRAPRRAPQKKSRGCQPLAQLNLPCLITLPFRLILESILRYGNLTHASSKKPTLKLHWCMQASP